MAIVFITLLTGFVDKGFSTVNMSALKRPTPNKEDPKVTKSQQQLKICKQQQPPKKEHKVTLKGGGARRTKPLKDGTDSTNSSDSNGSIRNSTHANSKVKSEKSTPGYEEYVRKHTKFNYYCTYCDFCTNETKEFLDHSLIQHRKTMYMCWTEDCVKFYETQNGLRLHCKQKHENVLKCLVCGLICLSPDLLEKHQKAHTVVKNFNCSKCEKKFSSAYDKNRHWKYNCPQNPSRVIKCKQCIAQGIDNPDVEGAEPGLLTHLSQIHGFEGRYLCLFCHKLFATVKKLMNHNKTCSRNHPDK